MAFLIAREIPNNGIDTALHRITFPAYGEKGWYRQMTSFSNFAHGIQKGVPASSRRYTCGWNLKKGILYALKTQQRHDEDMKSMLDSMDATNAEIGARFRADMAAVPVIEHTGLYAFYDHIGFDRQKRRYREDAHVN